MSNHRSCEYERVFCCGVFPQCTRHTFPLQMYDRTADGMFWKFTCYGCKLPMHGNSCASYEDDNNLLFCHACAPQARLSVIDFQSQVSHEVDPAVVGGHNVSAAEHYSLQCKKCFQISCKYYASYCNANCFSKCIAIMFNFCNTLLIVFFLCSFYVQYVLRVTQF